MGWLKWSIRKPLASAAESESIKELLTLLHEQRRTKATPPVIRARGAGWEIEPQLPSLVGQHVHTAVGT